ncbi:S15/NS1 RNA-binding protein [Zea mays]|uniref:S15/NS1 RNA-binding protein n=1 Tax=Zea mays TaxID=4577 RepID=A0A1D6IAJ8_MAIZE|nr:S15/NS1 RNA-binding protein [Zea mays]
MALRRVTPQRRPVLPLPRAFFSSCPPFTPPPSPANDPDDDHSPSSSPPPNPGAPRNPSSSLFQDIKDRLRLSPTSSPPRRNPSNLLRPNPARGPPSKPSLEEVRRMLDDFRPTVGAPSPSAPGVAPSFLDIIKRSSVAQGANAGQGVTGFDSVRESLKRSPLRTPHPPSTPFLTLSQSNIFSPELQRKFKAVDARKDGKESNVALSRLYSYEELGKKLGELRPAVGAKDGKEWFSLKELQGRIAKLAELEKQENQLSGSLWEIKNCIGNLNHKPENATQRVNIHALLNLRGQPTPDYMSQPPQEELLEKYFHPDHMSSEETMKLELQRVRDEFKMSENDCGSARVQSKHFILFLSSK